MIGHEAVEPDKELGSISKRCAACDLIDSNICDHLVAVKGNPEVPGINADATWIYIRKDL